MDTDKLIDNALSGYADATPRAGLEQRVLTRIRIAQVRRRRVWGAAIGLAAAVLFVIASIRTRPEVVPVVTPTITEVASGPSTTSRPAPVAIHKRRQHRAPGPTPLTGEERALIALVERHPAEALLAFADTKPQPIEPIEIMPIEIEPLPGYDPQ